jgi:hypothetical protein
MNNKKKEPATLHAIDFEMVSSGKSFRPDGLPAAIHVRNDVIECSCLMAVIPHPDGRKNQH